MVREWRSTELFTAYTTAHGPVPLQPCPLIPHHEDATSGEESWPIFATDFSDRFFLADLSGPLSRAGAKFWAGRFSGRFLGRFSLEGVSLERRALQEKLAPKLAGSKNVSKVKLADVPRMGYHKGLQ